MVLETIAANLLSKYLGDYLGGLQKENLKLSVLSGNVSLTNVELKREAVDSLDLPLIVKTGFVGKVALSIPWRNLGSQPALVSLDQVFLVVGPKDPNIKEDISVFEKREQDAKQKKLRDWEANKQAKLEAEAEAKGEKKAGFGAKLIEKVVDNIQVDLTNVHIRYEDDVTDPKNPFVIGITLERVSGKSTDSSWQVKWIEGETIVHKKFSLHNLAVYWNPNEPFLKPDTAIETGKVLLGMITTDATQVKHNYILKPVSGFLKVRMNKNEQPDMKIPKIDAQLEFPEIGFVLEELQYRNLTVVLETFSLYQRGIRYRKYRPVTPVKQSPRAWWKFLGDAVLLDVRQKKEQWEWSKISARMKLKREYIALYRKVNVGTKLTPTEDEQYKDIERKLSYEDIVLFRSIADVFLKKDKEYMEEQKKQKKAKAGWFGGWLGGSSQQQSDQEVLPELQLSQDEWNEVYATIGVPKEGEKFVDTSKFPKEYVQTKFSFCLWKASIELIGIDNPILKASISEVKGGLAIRPTSTFVEASIKSLAVQDLFTPKTLFPTLIGRNIDPGLESTNLLQVTFEMSPLTRSEDYYATLELKPLDIVYNKLFIDRLVSFLSNASPVALQNIQLQLLAKLKALREQTQNQLVAAMESKKIMGVSANLRAPTLILPADCQQNNTEMLVVDLGTLAISSYIKSRQEEEQDPYDDFIVILSQFKAFMADKTSDWRTNEHGKLTLIEGFDININLHQAKVETDKITKFKINGVLPGFRLNVSPEKINKLLLITSKAFASKTPQAAEVAVDQDKQAYASAGETVIPDEVTIKQQDKIELEKLQLMEASFEIQEIAITLEHKQKQIVVLRAQGFSVNMMKRTFDMKAAVNLKALVFEDCIQQFGPEFKYLISSVSEHSQSDFISINYLAIDKESPNYHKENQIVDMKFSSLHVMVNRETIVRLIDLANKIGPPKSETPSEPTVQSPRAVQENQVAKGIKPIKKGVRKSKDVCTLKLNADLGAVVITLNKEGQLLSEFAVSGLTSTVKSSLDGTMNVVGRLRSITIKDMTDEGRKKYVNVLDLAEDTNLVEFTYLTYIPEDEAGFDSHVILRMASVRFIFLNRFLSEVLAYVNEIQQMKDIVSGVSNAAYEKSKEVAETLVVEPAKLMKMDISITNPTIIVPMSSVSDDVLALDLGVITINNTFVKEEGTSEKIVLAINDFGIASAKLQGKKLSIVDKIFRIDQLKLHVNRTLDSKIPVMKVSAGIPEIAIALTEPQVALFLGIYKGNILAVAKTTANSELKQLESTSSKPPTTQTKEIDTTQSSGQVAPPKQSSIMELDFNLAKISLEFVGMNPVTSALYPVLGFYMNNLTVSLKQQNDEMNADLRIAAISVTDIRTDASPKFKHIFSQSGTESLIVIKYSRSNNGEQNVSITLGSPLLTVFPPTLLSTKEFAMRVLDTVNKSLESPQSAATPSSTAPTQAEAPKPAPSTDKQSKMNVNLLLNELAVQLVDGSPSREEKLATVAVTGLDVTLLKTDLDMTATVTLSGMSVQDHMQTGGPDFAYIVTTPTAIEDHHFITVNYVNIQKGSPNYEKIDQSVEVNFNSLYLTANRESTFRLLAFATQLQSKLQSAPQTKPTQTDSATVSTTVAPATPKDKSITTMNVTLTVQSVVAELCKDGKRLATASMNRLCTYVSMYQDGTLNVRGNLGGIIVLDFTDLGKVLYSQVVDIPPTEKQMIEYSYATYLPEDMGYDTAVQLKLHGMRFFFLNRFVNELLGYLNEMNAIKESIMGPATAAPTTQAQTETSTPAPVAKKQLMKLDITLDNPIIAVPESSSSQKLLQLDLGKITLVNQFEENQEKITVSMAAMNVTFGQFDAKERVITLSTNEHDKILDDTYIDVHISRSIDPKLPDMKIVSKLPRIAISLGVSQVEALAALYAGNMSETPQFVYASAPVVAQPVQPAEPQKKGGSPIDLKFELTQVSLELMDSANNTFAPVVAFYMNVLKIDFKQSVEGAMNVDLRITSIIVADIREGVENHYKQILAPQGFNSDEEALVMIKYAKSATGNQNIALILDRPTITVATPAVMAIKDFTMGLLASFQNTMAKLPAKPSPTNTNNAPKPTPAPVATSNTSMNVEVYLNESSIRLVEAMERRDSRALIVKTPSIKVSYAATTQANVSGSEQRATIVLQNFMTYKCMLMAEKETMNNIMEPFSINLDASIAANGNTDVTLVLDPVHLIFSYQDFKLIMGILNGMSSSAKAAPKPVEETKPTETPTPTSLEMPKKSEMFKFKKTSLRFSLINDYESLNTPVLDFVLLDFFTDVANWSNPRTMNIYFSTDLKANYFNARLQRWEPLIETWPIAFKMDKMLDTQAQGMDIAFNATQKLNINISTEFLDILFRSMKTWNEDYKQASPLTASRRIRSGSDARLYLAAHPYYIRNYTGVDITYWITQPGSTPSTFVLKADEECPLQVSDPKTPYSRKNQLESITASASYAKPRLSFQLDGVSKAVSDLSIDKVDSKSFDMDEYKVFYEVQYYAGSKVVEIRSAVIVENQTNTTVDLLVQLGSKQSTYQILPKGKTPVPVQFARKGFMAIRPSDQGFEWSERIECSTLSERKDVLHCQPPLGPQKFPFLFNMEIHSSENRVQATTSHWAKPTEKKTQTPAIVPSNAHWKVSLRPIVIIENVLPVPVEYQLSNFVNENNVTLLQRGSLDKGQDIQVHVVGNLNNLAISLGIAGYKSSKNSLIAIEKAPKSVELQDDRNRPLKIKFDNTLGVTKVRHIALYVKYWLYNRTGLRMLWGFNNNNKELAPGQTDVEADSEFWQNLPMEPSRWYQPKYKEPGPFMFSYPKKKLGQVVLSKKCYVKIAGSEWSKEGLGLDARGLQGVIEIADSSVKGQPTRKYEVSVTVDGARNKKFWRTKMITFAPRFMIVNKTEREIVYKQKNSKDIYWLGTGKQIPFHWPDDKQEKQLQLSFQEDGWLWSGGFAIDAPIATALKIQNKKDRTFHFARVHVETESKTTFVILYAETPEPPYMIKNDTPFRLSLNQKGVNGNEIVEPKSSLRYSWDEPSQPHILQVRATEGKPDVSEYKLDKIKKIGNATHNRWKAEVLAEGPTRVLQLSTPDVSKTATEQTTEPEVLDTKVILGFSGFGISLIDSAPQEIMYMSFDNIVINYQHSNIDTKIEFKLKSMQIDNQIPLTPFPVVLCAATADDKDILHMSMVKSTKYTKIDYYRYFSVLLQEIDLNVDEEFLIRLLNVVFDNMKIMKQGSEEESTNEPDVATLSDEATRQSSTRMVYYELFHINPVKANVSFVGVPGIKEQYSSNVAMMLGVSTKLLVNIDHAPLTLNLLMLKNPFTTQQDLTSRITSHYTRQGIQQVYKILGSFEFLGSPMVLVSNLGTGFYDFFHEPAQGIVSSPQDFGIGLAKGTKSLVKNSVYGIFNTVSKITGSITRGIETISLDKDYERERQQQQIREQPKHVGEGLLFGARDLGKGLLKGVTGLVEEPMKGAKKEGAEGFFKGLGIGVIGLAARPVMGVMDLATQTTKGIRNTTTMFDKKITSRKRPPRFIGPDKVLEPYNREKAEGAELMVMVDDNQFKDDTYLTHITVGTDRVLVASAQHLIFTKKEDNKLIWAEDVQNIIDIKENPDGLQIAVRKGEPRFLKMDRQTSQQIKAKMAAALQEANLHKA